MPDKYTEEDYKKAMELLRHIGTRKASKILGIPRSTLINWRRGQKPWQAKWTPKPTKELAYILGTLMGDAYLTRFKPNYQYDIRLAAKDRDFVDEFNRCLAVVLGRKPNKIIYDKRRGLWVARYGSKAFYQWFVSLDMDSLKRYVEHDEENVVFFLRGLFDSDGSITVNKERSLYKVKFSNTNLKLLHYVKMLLRNYFGIEALGPKIEKLRGGVSVKRSGEVITRRRDLYKIEIVGKHNVSTYLENIGFTIWRKQRYRSEI